METANHNSRERTPERRATHQRDFVGELECHIMEWSFMGRDASYLYHTIAREA